MKANPYLQLHCASPFAPFVEDYVAQKRALGNKCRSEVEILNMFDAYCIEQDITEPALTQEIYDSWCAKRPHESGSTQHIRVQQLRTFIQFLKNNGVSTPTVFLPLPKSEKTFVPYIFTHEEILRFIHAVDQTKPCIHYGRSSLAHLIMPVLFRMLYGCGLRIGEVVKLKTADVDTERGVIRLLETKGNKERLVPISATLAQICINYRSDPSVVNYGSEYFFPASDNLQYAHCTIYDRFGY